MWSWPKPNYSKNIQVYICLILIVIPFNRDSAHMLCLSANLSKLKKKENFFQVIQNRNKIFSFGQLYEVKQKFFFSFSVVFKWFHSKIIENVVRRKSNTRGMNMFICWNFFFLKFFSQFQIIIHHGNQLASIKSWINWNKVRFYCECENCERKKKLQIFLLYFFFSCMCDCVKWFSLKYNSNFPRLVLFCWLLEMFVTFHGIQCVISVQAIELK